MKSKQFYATTAWRWFSRYVMLIHAKESNGVYHLKCATSGRILQIPSRKAHAGHYIKVFNGNSTNFATAFDKRNVMPQSAQHNVYQSGNEIEMGRSIDRCWGPGTTEKLYIKSKKFCKLDPVTMKEISDKYRDLFKELAKVKGNPWK